MEKPDKKRIEKLKRQDKELDKLTLKKEESRFRKGESYLKRLIVPTRVETDVKKLKAPERKKRK
jgi:hypothetical protein